MSDEAFFEANPQRKYRLRLATQAEIEGLEVEPVPDRAVPWAVMSRDRRFFMYLPPPPSAPPWPLNEAPEDLAKAVFEGDDSWRGHKLTLCGSELARRRARLMIASKDD